MIDMAMLWYGTDYKQTTIRLNEDFGLNLPIGQRLSLNEYRAINDEIERHRKERKALQESEEQAHKAYLDAFEAWMKNEQIIQQKQPQGHFAEPDEEWLEAKMRQPELTYEMDCAEERWWKIRAEQKRRG